MDKFTQHTGKLVPLNMSNIDTDQIIPKQFLLAVDRKGFGHHLFSSQRWLDEAETQPNPNFALNDPVYAGASVLLARRNFGNGSSREHAPWALMDYGFKAIIAPSFADIFANNALGNGLVLVKLTEDEVDALFAWAKAHQGESITVDLENLCVKAGELSFSFTIDPFRRECLLKGLDAIGLTLENEAAIAAFEAKRPRWLNPRVRPLTPEEIPA